MTDGSDAAKTITVIAVHGNGGGGFRWERLPDPLDGGAVDLPAGSAPDAVADTTEKARVSLDGITLPGFQGTPLPAGTVTMETFSDAVAEVALTTAGRIVLLGHGIGGAITLDLAARHPQLVDGLILHSPVAVDLDTRLFPKLMKRRFVRTAAKRVISSKPVRLLASRFLFPNAPQDYSDRFLREYGRAEGFEVMFDILDAEWFDGLPAVTVPTVILWGERDRVLDVRQAETLERAIPHATRQIEHGWGHYPMIENPDDYARSVAGIARSIVADRA